MQISSFKWRVILLFTLVIILKVEAQESKKYVVSDLSFFNSAGKSWSIVGDVSIDLNKANYKFIFDKGEGVLLNNPTNKIQGEDIFTNQEFGDIDLDLKFMMVRNGNSGIYLQGRYEVQLEDSWFYQNITSASNGGIYNLSPPRFSVSKAPGLWQTLKVSFRAPRFSSNGQKIENAKILRVELNGVVVQEDVELPQPTPGAISMEEVAIAALRFQGDHGAVAFKDIVITDIEEVAEKEETRFMADPIWVDAVTTPMLRSFMDIGKGKRLTHAISIGSKEGLHYTYDLDHGALVQIWRGGFLDATPMWDGRGNGTSRPLGVVQSLFGQGLQVAKLTDLHSSWPTDTIGSGFKTISYTVDHNNIPTFVHDQYGVRISDRSEVLTNGSELNRTIEVDNPVEGLFVLVAESTDIRELSRGHFLIGNGAYYISIDDVKTNKPIVRDIDGKKQLLLELRDRGVNYSVIL